MQEQINVIREQFGSHTRHFDSVIGTVFEKVDKLSDSVGNLALKVESTSLAVQKVDKIADLVENLARRSDANDQIRSKTPTLWMLIGACVGTATLVSMVISGILYLISTATAQNTQFVREMTENGAIYTKMADFDARINRIEKAITWKATFE